MYSQDCFQPNVARTGSPAQAMDRPETCLSMAERLTETITRELAEKTAELMATKWKAFSLFVMYMDEQRKGHRLMMNLTGACRYQVQLYNELNTVRAAVKSNSDVLGCMSSDFKLQLCGEDLLRVADGNISLGDVDHNVLPVSH